MNHPGPPLPPHQTLPTMYDLPSEDPNEVNPSVPHSLPPWQTLPTMYDLPSEDPEEPGLPDEFHDFQPQLFRETCKPRNYPLDQIFIGTDLNLYYDSRHPQWHKRPDCFLVLGVPRAQQQQEMRWSYVVWQEGVNPFLVIELLSPGTEAEDLGQTLRSVDKPPTKWQVYEQILRIPYYVLFDRYENQLRVFQVVGTHYQAVAIPDQRFWIEEMQLGLGVWQGSYQGTEGLWLRWYDAANTWIPTEAERADREQQRADEAQQRVEWERQRANREQQRAEEERQRAEEERQRAISEAQERQLAQQRADQLADRLRALGIDPDRL